MGIINRRPLASSVVGTPGTPGITPGLDFSMARGLSSLASGLDAVAFQIRKNQEPIDQLEAIRASQNIDIDYGQAINRFQSQVSGNPNVDAATYQKAVMEIENATKIGGINSIENKRIKNLVAIDQERKRASRLSKANEWFLGEQGIRAKVGLTDIQNQNVSKAAGLSNVNELINHLIEVNGYIDQASGVLSQEEQAKFRIEFPKANVQAYVSSKIDHDPAAGYAEFRDDPFFISYFDAKERETVEKQFVKAITGQDKLENFQFLLKQFKPFNEIIEDSSLIGDAPRLVKILDTMRSTGLDHPGLEKTMLNMIEAARTQTRLDPSKDPMTLVNLEVQEDTLNRLKEAGNSEDIIEGITDFTGNVLEKASKGLISVGQAQGLLIPANELMQETAETIGEPGFIGRIIDAATKIANPIPRYDTRGVIERYFTHPVKQAPGKVISKIAPFKLNDEKRSAIKGRILSEFYHKMAEEKADGGEITKEKVDMVLDNIYKKVLPEYGLGISEKTSMLFLDPLTGNKYAQLPNGEYALIG